MEFWAFYLHEHGDSRNRAMHLAGTTLAAACVVAAAWNPWALLGALVGGYGFAWVGHLVFERNRPATFKHPWRSLASDWRMWGLWLAGRLGRELDKHGVTRRHGRRGRRERPDAS